MSGSDDSKLTALVRRVADNVQEPIEADIVRVGLPLRLIVEEDDE